MVEVQLSDGRARYRVMEVFSANPSGTFAVASILRNEKERYVSLAGAIRRQTRPSATGAKAAQDVFRFGIARLYFVVSRRRREARKGPFYVFSSWASARVASVVARVGMGKRR